MKASFLWAGLGLTGAWAKLTRLPIFDPGRRGRVPAQPPTRPTGTPSVGFFARLDRWVWRQAQRERDAYLAGASDIYDLEARIRRLERSSMGGLCR